MYYEMLLTFIGYVHGLSGGVLNYEDKCFKEKFWHPILYKQVDIIPEYHGEISKNSSYIKGCAEKAQSLGTQYFAVKEGGGCLASIREEESFKFRGNWQSGSNCVSGIGGPGEISIYYLRKFKSLLQFYIVLNFI